MYAIRSYYGSTDLTGETKPFHFALATGRYKDNPVFYVQYAHARVCSVLP